MIKAAAFWCCEQAGWQVALRYAIEIVGRGRGRLLLVAARAAERAEIDVDLPGLEKSPVEQALPEEELWPTTGAEPGELPDFLRAAAEKCESTGVFCHAAAVNEPVDRWLAELSAVLDLVMVVHPQRYGPVSLPRVARLVRASAAPVWIAPLEYRNLRTVLAWFDGSGASGRALRWACQFAATYNLKLVAVAAGRSRTAVDEIVPRARLAALAWGTEHQIYPLAGVPLGEAAGIAEEREADALVLPAIGAGLLQRCLRPGHVLVAVP